MDSEPRRKFDQDFKRNGKKDFTGNFKADSRKKIIGFIG